MSMFKRERLAEVEAKVVAEGPRHTVLIVDDEEGNLRALRAVLGTGFNILEAKDGQEALELLQSLPADQAPAVILSDQRMPRMTGVELFTHLRDSLPTSIRIIITGFVDVGAIVEAINSAGIYKFVVKPFDQQQLRLTVSRAIETFEERLKIQGQIQSLESRVGENVRKLERNIQALRRAHAEIARAGLVDELTGLGNRRLLINALDGREAGAKQPGAQSQELTHSAFVLLHLSDFAGINSRLGSAGGDAVLRAVAALLRERCPQDGIVVRLEGATFLLHLAAADLDQAGAFAVGVRDALATADLDAGEGQSLRCNCRIGVVALPFVDNDQAQGNWELALAAAGAALRLAQREADGSVLGLTHGDTLPSGFGRNLVADPQPLLDEGVIRIKRFA